MWRTIVGISPSIRHNEARDMQPNAAMYLPYRQEPPSGASVNASPGPRSMCRLNCPLEADTVA